MNKVLQRWYLFVMVYLCGVYALYTNGIFVDIYENDVTKLTFVIYGLFILSTGILGWVSHKCKLGPKKFKHNKFTDMCWFMSDAMMTLGLIGTVAGMIFLFGMIFGNIDPSVPEDLKNALGHMATGLSTAMYTTIVGMVCSLLTRVQLMNIEYG
ncbi:MAG: hypothetical protein CMD98_06655 [Gammaproteobacteria bacterium]|nr:hypothetical protein [Gammaproteobacteria bacterium]|tara:strand:+ start:7663 stop:8124 length:462 start_codon:yes stop_codon:yes gene_type:complete